MDEGNKKTFIIVAIVAAVLLCCCCLLVVIFWYIGDCFTGAGPCMLEGANSLLQMVA